MIRPNKNIPTALFVLLISAVGVAQDVGGGSGPPPPQGGPTPPGLPIDNGLVILFVAAVVYGVYIILKSSKKKTQA